MLTLQLCGLSIDPGTWSLKARMNYKSQKPSLFHVHFLLGGKDKTDCESQDCFFASCAAVRFAYSIRVGTLVLERSLFHVLFDLFASISVLLYYIVLFHILLLHLVSFFPLACLRPISQPFPFCSPVHSQSMDPWVPLPPHHGNQANP